MTSKRIAIVVSIAVLVPLASTLLWLGLSPPVEARDGFALDSADELDEIHKELQALGFRGAGHTDGDMTDPAGNHYTVSGYGYIGEYNGARTEVEISICHPAEAGLPTKRTVTIRSWARWRGRAEAASRELAQMLRERAQT